MKYGVMISAAVAALLLLGGCETKENRSPQHETSAVQAEGAESGAKTAEPQRVEEKGSAQSTEEKSAAPEESVTQQVSEAAEAVQQKSAEIAESVKEKAEAVTEAVSDAVTKAEGSGDEAEALYKSKCAGCHGAKGEKHALGKSEVLAGQKRELLVQKIRGYKEGTFGGAMKSIMKSQVASLDDAQIEALAGYIATLK
ncbi:c-type cytochrome [Hydrogenimonas sp.]